jgi:hypothetical protein
MTDLCDACGHAWIKHTRQPNGSYACRHFGCGCRDMTSPKGEAGMTEDEMRDKARGNIERHLGDVCDGEESADAIYDEAYTLGFDALHDAGVNVETARRIAAEVAQTFAQP